MSPLRFNLPLFFVLLAPCFGGAPEKIDGFIYYETGSFSGPKPLNRYQQSASVFSANGIFNQIYARENPGASFDGSTVLQPPTNGAYTYRKIDDTTAELAFTTSSFAHSGLIKFSSATSDSGNFVDPTRDPLDLNGIVSRSFRLVPLSVLSPLVNCSNRSFVRAGGTAYTGFVVTGSVARIVLIRAVGPGLNPFGVTATLRDPVLKVHVAAGGLTWQNDNWWTEDATSIQRTSAAVGAFALPDRSLDAATIIPLAPGAYIAEVSSTDAGLTAARC
jgi:hypothetical protein